jgi:hypothetical protein
MHPNNVSGGVGSSVPIVCKKLGVPSWFLGQKEIGFVIQEIVGLFCFAALDGIAADDDTTFGEINFLANGPSMTGSRSVIQTRSESLPNLRQLGAETGRDFRSSHRDKCDVPVQPRAEVRMILPVLCFQPFGLGPM